MPMLIPHVSEPAFEPARRGSAPRMSALVIDPNLDDVLRAVATLTRMGFDAIVAETFDQARAIVSCQHPAVLVTELRLGEYNGLHLVMRAKALHPPTSALILSRHLDPVLQAEAERLGATCASKPIGERELAAAVARTVFRASGDRGVIRPPFERRQADRRMAAADPPGILERRLASRRRHLLPAGDALMLH
jgi:DNA-binding NtrC family response regulator